MPDWMPVPSLRPYEVSADGRVRNTATDRILKGQLTHDGYIRYTLAGRRLSAHRLVLEAFVGPDDRQVAHLDGDPANNRLENLAYVTASENEAHKASHGTKVEGEGCHLAKLTDEKVIEIRALRQQGLSLTDIASRFGVSKQNVGFIVHGVTWKHLLETA